MKHILCIDDDPNMQRLVKKVLENNGYSVAVADDGESGITLAQAEPLPDLILVDVMLPGLNGLETAKHLRQIEQHVHTPIIALTAFLDKYKSESYLEAGFTAYLEKEMGNAPLIELVQRYLG